MRFRYFILNVFQNKSASLSIITLSIYLIKLENTGCVFIQQLHRGEDMQLDHFEAEESCLEFKFPSPKLVTLSRQNN